MLIELMLFPVRLSELTILRAYSLVTTRALGSSLASWSTVSLLKESVNFESTKLRVKDIRMIIEPEIKVPILRVLEDGPYWYYCAEDYNFGVKAGSEIL